MDQLEPFPVCDDVEDGEAAARQRDPRESMLLMAPMVVAGDQADAVTLRVRNLSAGGLMAECDRRFTTGERVEVELRNLGPVPGTIVWVAASRLGVRFDRAIDPKAARRPIASGVVTSKIIVGQHGRRPGFHS